MTSRILIAISLAFILSGCSHSGTQPVPKPVAYPRINLYPADYKEMHSLRINSNAKILLDSLLPDGSLWLTADYPRYNSTLYITRTKVAQSDIGEAVSNRIERMALNNGGAGGELLTFDTTDGYSVRILITPRGSANPAQLVAVNTATGSIISASAVMNSPDAVSNHDSIAPVVRALRDDIVALIKK